MFVAFRTNNFLVRCSSHPRYEDIEAQVLAERQALLPFEDLMAAGADEGPRSDITDDEIKRVIDESLRQFQQRTGGALRGGEKTSAKVKKLLELVSQPASTGFAEEPAAPPADGSLDPTQAALVIILLKHYASAERKILRLLLQGLAGTGKSFTIKDLLRALVEIFGRTDCFRLMAPTGVASQALAELGCETIDSVLKTMQQELSESQVDELADHFAEVIMVIVDEMPSSARAGAPSFVKLGPGGARALLAEISMQGRVKLGRMSRNLDIVMRRVWIRRRVAEDPFYDVSKAPSCAELFPRGFGGLDALFIGDFGQIAPVKDRTLMDPRRERISGNLQHALSNAGMERFQDFLRDDADDLEVHAIRLRRVYRNKDASSDLRRAQVRARDFALGVEDYELLASRDIAKLEGASGEEWMEDATWICFENRFVGERNGQRLGERARATKAKIHRIAASFSCGRARELAGQKKFDRLRSTVHLALGALVMLTSNTLWGRRVVPLGLCNGARGVVRGFRYDGSGGLRYVLVEFPSWAGAEFSPAWGPQVVPVPVLEDSLYGGRYWMAGVPLVLAGTLSGHKSQGLTLIEGTIVDFRTSRSLGQLGGLPFVTLTRCQGLGRLAVANLPPFNEFFAGRDTEAFRNRQKFEERFDELHDRTMRAAYGDISEAELHLRAADGRLTREQFEDVKEQLAQRGVVRIPESTEEEVRKLSGKQVVDWPAFRNFAKKPRGAGKQTLLAAAKAAARPKAKAKAKTKPVIPDVPASPPPASVQFCSPPRAPSPAPEDGDDGCLGEDEILRELHPAKVRRTGGDARPPAWDDDDDDDLLKDD